MHALSSRFSRIGRVVVGVRSRALSTSPPSTNPFAVSTSAIDELFKSKTEILNSLGEPTFESLGIGGGLWPSSIPLKLLELLHVDCGLSWWSCALVLGVAVRALMFYPTLLSRRTSSGNDDQLARVGELSEKFKLARETNNVAEMRRLTAELQGDGMAEARSQTASLVRRGLLALGTNLFCVFVVHVNCIRAVYSVASLPVQSLQSGGLLWLQDLTCADPYGVVPAFATCLLLLNVRYFYRVAPDTRLLRASQPLAFTLAPMLFFTFLLNCPGASLLYFVGTGGAALLTNLTLERQSSQLKSFDTKSVKK